MRCIFCKADSSASRSVEHIVPESLGNSLYVLPTGVVCDVCNNYFARKVEQPFLESATVRALRFRQGIPNKRGLVPAIKGVLWPAFPAQISRPPGPGCDLFLDTSDAGVASLLNHPTGQLIFPIDADAPEDVVVSRFLAKCALEAFAQRLIDNNRLLDELVDHNGLDPLREHARYGQPLRWPYSARRIYAENSVVPHDGQLEQTLHEYDILFTTPDRMTPTGFVSSEVYFVMGIFGLELVLNMGGPELDGYQRWLLQNDGASPLYNGKNSTSPV